MNDEKMANVVSLFSKITTFLQAEAMSWPRCLAAIAFDHTLGWGLIGDDSVSSVTAIKRAVKWTQSECASNAKVALEHQAS